MPTGMSAGLWLNERDKIIFVCCHCGERGEAGEKPFPRGLCPSCTGIENRKQMHEENLKVMPNWICKVCARLSTAS